MSGKSTLLRTLGVNVVLAQAGSAGAGASFRLSPLAVGASISIQDSLADGRSRFLAEIQRLKQIVDLVKSNGGRTLFLLDEILGGTNSHDRRIGAEAVLASLVADGAIGLATTHDLAIGEIADRMPSPVTNVHFVDEFRRRAPHVRLPAATGRRAVQQRDRADEIDWARCVSCRMASSVRALRPTIRSLRPPLRHPSRQPSCVAAGCRSA